MLIGTRKYARALHREKNQPLDKNVGTNQTLPQSALQRVVLC
jgi:hypothetical protein